MLLKSLLSKHASYNNEIKKKLSEILIKIPGCPELEFAPVKGAERAMVKLKENIAENPDIKFPLNSLKDLSRGSLIFESANELLKLKDAIINGIKADSQLKLSEIKNMF